MNKSVVKVNDQEVAPSEITKVSKVRKARKAGKASEVATEVATEVVIPTTEATPPDDVLAHPPAHPAKTRRKPKAVSLLAGEVAADVAIPTTATIEAAPPDAVAANPPSPLAKTRRKPKAVSLPVVPVPVPVPVVPVPASVPCFDVAPKSVTPSDVPAPHVLVRSARPSSRLVQLTVPSMAQSVASTAAKASFTQMTAVTPIASPVAGTVKKDNKLANNWKKKPAQELTDAEILAMPDEEYMNATQLAFFRHKLVKLKTDMLSNAGETSEHLREDTVIVPDPTDRATIEEEHALELRTRDRERKLLKKIDQSIASVDAGTYGLCEETGENIGVGRLLARPTAHLSLEAQQRHELKQKMFGD